MASDHITDAMVEAAGKELWSHAEHDNDAMRAALLAAERAAWQPIETAPRDGRRIWLPHPDGKPYHAAEGFWTALYGGCWYAASMGALNGTWKPPVWRPLPPAPEADHG